MQWFSEVLYRRKRRIYGQQEMGLVEDMIMGPILVNRDVALDREGYFSL